MKKLLLLCIALLASIAIASADTSYNINVGGVEVKASNASNVTGGDITAYKSSSSYSVTYNASTKTLTLTNVKIKRNSSGNFAIHNRGQNGLNIVFYGDNYLYSDYDEAIKCEKNTTITSMGEVKCDGEGQRAIYIKGGCSLTFAGSGVMSVFGSVSGINGEKGTESVISSMNKLTINSYGASLKKLKQITVNSRNTSLPISSQLVLQDMWHMFDESDGYYYSYSDSPKLGSYTEDVTSVSYGTGVAINRPIYGATYTSSGFVYYGTAMSPSSDGKIVISDERDDPSATMVGNFLYKTSGSSSATLVAPTMAYKRSKPTTINVPGYVSMGGYLRQVAIRDSAFWEMKEVQSIKMNYGVTSIGLRAFKSCDNLSDIKIPSSVTSIADYIINGGKRDIKVYWATTNPLKASMSTASFFISDAYKATLVFPTYGVKTAAQTSLSSFRGITFGDADPDNAYDLSNGVTSFVVTKAGSTNGTDGEMVVVGGNPGNIGTEYTYSISATGNGTCYYATAIAPYAYYKNTKSYSSISIPDKVKTIGEYAFSNCTKATSVRFGSGLTSIASTAFDGCTGVRTVVWDVPDYNHSGTASLLGSLFNSNNITTVTIGSSVTSVPQRLCSSLANLTSLSIGSSVRVIGDYAFYACGKLTSVTLPNSLKTIYNYAFANTGLSSLTVPYGVTYIGSSFYNCNNLKSVALPTSLKTIASNAFTATGLTALTVPDGVTSIGDNSFGNCTSLTDVTIGTGVESLSATAFASSNAIKKVTWNVASNIGFSKSPFYNSRYSINSFTFGNTVTTIPDFICNDLTNLSSVSIGNSVKTIGNQAFSLCKNLTSVIIPNSVTYIGHYAFWESGLTNITLGSNVTSLGTGVFYACSSLQKADLKDAGLTEIPEVGFYSCSALSDLSMPDGITKIGKQAFLYAAIEALDLPKSLETIDESAFADCANLKSVYLYENVSEIGEAAFYNDNALEDIYSAPSSGDIYLGKDVFTGVPKSSSDNPRCTLHVKSSCLSGYKTANQWKEFFDIVGDLGVIKGDLNGDGSIDGSDVSILLEMVLAGGVTDSQKAAADLNDDGSVDGSDVSILLEMVLAGN